MVLGADVSVGRSYMEGLRQTQFETEVDVVELGARCPPRTIAEALGTSGELLHIVRVRRQRRTGEPLIVTDVWLPRNWPTALTESALQRAPLYELLSDAGIALDRVRHEITAEIAGPRNARLLDTAIGAALLRLNRLASTPATCRITTVGSVIAEPQSCADQPVGAELETADGLASPTTSPRADRLARVQPSSAVSIASASGAQSPAPGTSVASAPAAQARCNARRRCCRRTGIRRPIGGQHAGEHVARPGGVHALSPRVPVP